MKTKEHCNGTIVPTAPTASTIVFNKKTTQSVEEPKANSTGLDLTDETAIGFTIAKLKFTVMGFRPSAQYDTLIATVKVAHDPHKYDAYTHIQKIDLYINDRVNTYCRTAAQQLKVNETDVKNAMYSLRERLGQYRNDALKNLGTAEKKVVVSDALQKEAMEYLKSDILMDIIEKLLEQVGVVTEMQTAQQLFFILLSRHFDRPLHAILQGNQHIARMLMDTVSMTIPEEQIHERTSISNSSLYYTRTRSYWREKVLYLKYMDKEFRGAGTIREFIENGFLKRHTTESDYQTHQLHAAQKIVDGAICLMSFCNDDNFNARFFGECFVLRVTENDSTRAAMQKQLQLETAGQIDPAEKRTAIQTLKTMQRLLKPVRVIIPFATEVQLPKCFSHQLRGLPQLFALIKSVAYLHQHRLKKHKDDTGEKYIEATVDHLVIATELFQSISVSQSDLLTQKQRTFIEQLKKFLQIKYKITDEQISVTQPFKIPEAFRSLHISPASFYRLFEEVKILGYVKKSGGDKKNGIEYQLVEWEDYKRIAAETDEWIKKLKTIKK